jgi:hypothetical protein
MVGDSGFTFKATSLTRFSISVSATGVQILSDSAREPGKFERSWDIAFADLAGVTVYRWSTRGAKGEAVYLHPKHGSDVMFSTTSSGRGRGLTQEDREGYDSAAAAVFEALAAARPDIQVRLGRPPYFKLKAGFVLALVAAASSAAWLAYAEGVSEVNRLATLALIVGMYAVWGIYRLDLLNRPGFAGIRQVAAEMAGRLPTRGPWGASTAT